MNFPTIQAILDEARTYLNVSSEGSYANETLISRLRIALNELDGKLAENGIQVLQETSANFDVPASTSRIAYVGTTPLLPVDLKEILTLEEKVDGAGDDTFVPVTKRLNLPVRKGMTNLSEYVWHEQELKFIAALNAVDIRIKYVKGFPDLTLPVDPTQTIPFNRALPFLAAKTGAIAAATIMKDFDRAQVLHEEAQDRLNTALNINVRSQQDTPVRRRGWSRRGQRSYISRIR